ncbi:MotA/TolQ/ExbB proton channel family protein [Microbacterium sp. zg.Y1090]|uniref:motility protein A n=1 Tax=Microbacterium TaxID=33882 RepID=UPI00214C3E2D|nr:MULTISPECIES: MotA/TolQ/ExbB proton channel family protein [unclassified Microbacterium]MCR2813987.1 MotA/TolQ/ExbB proton channel family protein [Microbacterium sp. zg.Y1084]MCR2819261.1 MotA/TolQ/ExbB proton channel family protein [Microbacterium sp. zg.Y1090]MDL5487178.1 MotA/TolQ/ExbB proton channel family protein [Microbacterium sp. zg-Y1211]WIM28243.1 MotA/TolQ/ExbB proton channel family protein [Microbacterium sp. zg-Y1090]
MDPSLLIGIVIAFGALLAMISLEGAHVSALLLPAPMVLVFGATIAIGIAGGTVSDAVEAVKALPRAFRGLRGSSRELIEKVVGYADIARTRGLLALESAVDEEKDPFVRQALQNIADGTDADDLRVMMEDQVATTAGRRRTAARFYSTLGGYAPTVGIVGTVISLTHVLEKLDQPDTLGPLIAAAFVATLWGLLSANFIWLPIGTRLQRLAEIEIERMTLLTEGMLAVQSGSPPHLVQERLLALAPEPVGKAKRRGGKAAESADEAA